MQTDVCSCVLYSYCAQDDIWHSTEKFHTDDIIALWQLCRPCALLGHMVQDKPAWLLVTQWHIQNKGKASLSRACCLVLNISLTVCILRASMADFVLHDWVMQRPTGDATEIFVELCHWYEISDIGCGNNLTCQERCLITWLIKCILLHWWVLFWLLSESCIIYLEFYWKYILIDVYYMSIIKKTLRGLSCPNFWFSYIVTK